MVAEGFTESVECDDITGNQGPTPAEVAVAIAFTPPQHEILSEPLDVEGIDSVLVLPDIAADGIPPMQPSLPAEAKPQSIVEGADAEEDKPPNIATLPALSEVAVAATVPEPTERASAVTEIVQKDIEPSKPPEPKNSPAEEPRVTAAANEQETPAETQAGHDDGDDGREPPTERPTADEGDESPKKREIVAANKAADDVLTAAIAAKSAHDEYEAQFSDPATESPEQAAALQKIADADNDYDYLLIMSDWKKATEMHPLLEDMRQLEEEYEMVSRMVDADDPLRSRLLERIVRAKERLKHELPGTDNQRVASEDRPRGEEWLVVPEGREVVEHLDSLLTRLCAPYSQRERFFMFGVIYAGLHEAYKEAGFDLDRTAHDAPSAEQPNPPSLENIKEVCNLVALGSDRLSARGKFLVHKWLERLGENL